ncbi:MAG: hypothetical protein WBW04_08450, partial [Nitrolancea sp.]
GFSLALWWIPVGAIAVGLLILGGFVTQRQRLASQAAGNGSNAVVDEVDDSELALFEARIQSDVAAYEEDLMGKVIPPKVTLPSTLSRTDDPPPQKLAGSDQGIS